MPSPAVPHIRSSAEYCESFIHPEANMGFFGWLLLLGLPLLLLFLIYGKMQAASVGAAAATPGKPAAVVLEVPNRPANP